MATKNQKRIKKYCKDCIAFNNRSKWSNLQDWCCKHSTVIQKAYSICLQQNTKIIKED